MLNYKKGILLSGMIMLLCLVTLQAQVDVSEEVISEKLLYHPIHLNSVDHTILPWYNPEPGIAYDHIINLVWNFWINMRIDFNGLPYYMNHQVWRGDFNDRRGIGGDQLSMAL